MNFFAHWMNPSQTSKPLTKYDIAWYDIQDDWDLIVVSIAQQYGYLIDELEDDDMYWKTFLRLVSGLRQEKCDFGDVVAIRAEERHEIRKKFSMEEKKIWLEWQKRVPIEYKQQKMKEQGNKLIKGEH